jgi:uncharacterized membrane protein YccC
VITGLPTWREWLFSAKAFLAAMLALYIALSAGLSRPYWAMAAVYVVANPLSGATRSKALFRILGTMIGATGSVVLMPLLVSAPELFSVAVALWTGGFLFVSFLDRTARSYVFMLAGYSLPLIALPAVSDPVQVFDIAVSRSLEIGIGIVCASLVNSLILPAPIGPVLGARTGKWLGDAGEWIAAILRDDADAAAMRERQRLAVDIRSFDMLISQLAYDAAVGDTVQRAEALRGRMALLLPLLSSLGDRLDAVGKAAGGQPPALAGLTRDIIAWIGTAGDDGGVQAASLQQRVAALEPEGPRAAEWEGLLLSSALERLRELLDLWQDCRLLQEGILEGGRAGRFRPSLLRHHRAIATVPHFDYGLMAFSALSVVAVTLLACLIWIYTGWQEGAGFAIMTAVGCSFFAAVDNPAPMIKSFVVWMSVSAVISAVYLFGILPNVQDFTMLVLVLAPPFMLAGTLVGRPQYMLIAMLLSVNIASLVGLQEIYAADFTTFVNGNLASVAGGIMGLVWSMATRPFGAALAARRLVRAGWGEIAATAAGSRNADPLRFAGRMFDRLSQLVPRLAQGVSEDVAATDMLAELRIGMNLLDLKRLEPQLVPHQAGPVRAVLQGVAAAFAARMRSGRNVAAPDTLLADIDAALVALSEIADPAIRRTALQAMVGLRRALFAGRPAPGLGEPSDAALAPLALAAE